MKLFLFLFFLLGCSSPKMLLESAKKDEQNQRYDKAEQKYFTVVIKHSDTIYAVEARYRLALLYKDIKKDYLQAQMWFNEIIARHPGSEYAKLAEVGILESPDYTGVLDGNVIVLGDVESYGKNMKLTAEFTKLEYNLYIGRYKLFAGDRLVRQYEKYYLKQSGEVREYDANPQKAMIKNYSIIMKLPIKSNVSWTTIKDNKEVVYTIVATGLQLKLRDKTFDDCIKVREYVKGERGVRFIYYAANKGCVKMTTGLLDGTKEFPVVESIQ